MILSWKGMNFLIQKKIILYTILLFTVILLIKNTKGFFKKDKAFLKWRIIVRIMITDRNLLPKMKWLNRPNITQISHLNFLINSCPFMICTINFFLSCDLIIILNSSSVISSTEIVNTLVDEITDIL